MTEPLDDARGVLACKPVSHYESRDCYHIEACPHFVAVILRAQKAEAELAALRAAPERCDAGSADVRAKLYELLRLFRDDYLSADETISGILQDAAALVPPPSEAGRLRLALEEIKRAYVEAPGWAAPTPTTELIWKMYTIARAALSDPGTVAVASADRGTP